VVGDTLSKAIHLKTKGFYIAETQLSSLLYRLWRYYIVPKCPMPCFGCQYRIYITSLDMYREYYRVLIEPPLLLMCAVQGWDRANTLKRMRPPPPPRLT
jgi:hypothetical protein